MKTVAFVPLKAVPVCVPFRYNKKWWKRKIGAPNWIISLKDEGKHQTLDESCMVALIKNELRSCDRYMIIEELKGK